MTEQAKTNYFQAIIESLQPYRKRVTIGLIAAMLGASFDAIGPMLMKMGVDTLRESQAIGMLYTVAGLIILAAGISGLFRFAMRNIVISISRWVESDLRGSFFSHLLKLSPTFFDKNHTGDLMARATDDVERIRMVTGPALLYSTSTLLILIVSAAMMIYIDLLLAGVVFLLAPIVALTVLAVSKRLHNANLLQQESYGRLTSHVQENLSGIRVVKAFAREDNENSRFVEVCWDYYKHSLGVARIQALFMPILSLLISCGVVGILWIGGQRVITGVISLGDFVAFLGYLSLMTWPMISVGWVAHMYQRGAASHKRLMQIYQENEQFADNSNGRNPQFVKLTQNNHKNNGRTSAPPEIVYKNVTFRYSENSPDILNNIDLLIPSGTSVAVVGSTGSGKSTLIRLLPRLYQAQHGEILLDGKNISMYPTTELRSLIGYVDQTPFMFSDTISANIRFGRPDATVEQIMEAAHIACLDKDIQDFPNRYDTLLGERGVTLSGGQQQRLTLARALLLDSPILLLDDSLSAVDADTEADIISRLSQRLEGRTTIIVTHRLAVAQRTDKIIVLDRGRIAEQGSHDELMGFDGHYAQMYRQQQLVEELGALT